MTTRDNLNLSEAAELTGLTTRALARRIERGSLPATKGEDGLRYVKLRDLIAADLVDPVTLRPPPWAGQRVDAYSLARAITEELTARGVRIHELDARLGGLSEQVQKLRAERDEARRERDELRHQPKK